VPILIIIGFGVAIGVPKAGTGRRIGWPRLLALLLAINEVLNCEKKYLHKMDNNQLSIETASVNALAVLPSVLASKMGVSVDLVLAVSAAVSKNTIRVDVTQSGERALIALSAELEFCVKSFTSCPKTDDFVFDECVEFVIERFGFLNISEIRQAFRRAAAGELGVSLDAYYGTFTVGMLGKVLSAYVEEVRNAVVAEVVQAEKRVEFAQAKALASSNHDFDAWGRRRLEYLCGKEDLSANDCTIFDFEFFCAGRLTFTQDEKRLLWSNAYGLALGDYQNRAARGDYSARCVLRDPLKDAGFNLSRINWYKRLLVIAWVSIQKSVHQ
jgi:hypothetical protein